MEQHQQQFHICIIAFRSTNVNDKEEIFLKNQGIREYAKSKGVLLWQIADELGVNDGNFSRRLRHELTPEETANIMQIIEKISEEQR